jgi:hypothetical protein
MNANITPEEFQYQSELFAAQAMRIAMTEGDGMPRLAEYNALLTRLMAEFGDLGMIALVRFLAQHSAGFFSITAKKHDRTLEGFLDEWELRGMEMLHEL